LIFQVLYLDRVYPGVSVMDIDASGMTQPELIAAIDAKTPQYLDRSVTIEAGDQSWTYTGQELGLRINPTVIATEVFAVGRQGDFFADMIMHLNLLTTPYQVDPLVWYDTGPTNLALQQLAAEINRPPRDAHLVIQPDAQVEVTPAQRGRQLHLDATRTALESALFGNKGSQVTAVVQEVLPAIPDVETARQQAERLLSGPLTFVVKIAGETAASVQLEPETLAAFIEVVEQVDDSGRTQVSLALDPQNFAPYFEELAAEIEQAPQDAKLDFDEANGQLIVLEESRPGYNFDLAGAYAAVADLVETSPHTVELPLISLPPSIPSDDLDSLGIKAVVSEATSYFKGSSAGRMHNIELAASKFQNVIVPPDTVFSFNRYLGDVSTEEGYDESLIIFGNRTTVGIGGGVCQVSTTAFRAAFFGGFELVERWAHGYRVSWYEINSVPGLDATVYSPSVDFKFRNDTENYILIKTETDLEVGTLTFRFYGTPTGREVIVSEPEQTNMTEAPPPVYEEDPLLPTGTVKQVDWENDGLDVTVTRLVKEGETIIHEDEIVSRYRPWQAIFKVGSGG
jgi:vancomycin resistance protein YoaR